MNSSSLTRRRAISAALFSAGTLAAISAVQASTGPASASKATGGIKVLTALPVAYALTQWLLDGTAVTLQRAAPESLPPTRHAAYFAGRGAAALSAAAGSADAVVGLRSVWPDDPLFPLARRTNIRIVEIDAARPVDGALPGVALNPGSTGEGMYAWLDPTNLGRMADIVAHDLKLLAPESADHIADRLASYKREVVKLAAKAGIALAGLDDVTVFSLSDRLDHFATGFNLDLLGRDARDDTAWSATDLSALSQRLRSDGVAAVLHHREPAAEVAAAVSAGSARLVVLSTQGADPLAELTANVEKTVQGLSTS